jgi:hypothetical protein
MTTTEHTVLTYYAPVAATLVGDYEYVVDEYVTAWELGDGKGPDSAQWWADHGISPEVREARPYERWSEDDVAIVRKRFMDLIDAGSLRSILRKARKADGVIINRRPIPGWPRIAPEIRPDKAVFGGRPKRHWHGDGEPPGDDKYYRLIDPDSRSGKAHISRSRDKGDPEKLAKPGTEYMGDHFGVNTERVHWHTRPGKYQFPMAPMVDEPYEHDHDEQYKPPKRPAKKDKYSNSMTPEEKRAHHVERKHGGVDEEGMHSHIRRVPDPRRGPARRIDVHPMAWGEIARQRVIFFGIEGCIKADAILSAGGAVFSIPSVTLWETPALPFFIRKYLQGKTAIIVPDADWIENGRVITQARLCATYLNHRGVEAYIAAPPHDRLDEDIKGVDDYLGKGDGTLGGLIVQTRTVSDLAHKAFLRRFYLPKYGMNEGSKPGMLNALYGLAMHHNADGEYTASVEMLAKVTGATGDRKPRKRDRTREEREKRELNAASKRMMSAIRGLEKLGALTIDGDLSVRRKYNSDSWEEDTPVITLIEELRGWELPPGTLDELLHGGGARWEEAKMRLGAAS